MNLRLVLFVSGVFFALSSGCGSNSPNASPGGQRACDAFCSAVNSIASTCEDPSESYSNYAYCIETLCTAEENYHTKCKEEWDNLYYCFANNPSCDDSISHEDTDKICYQEFIAFAPCAK